MLSRAHQPALPFWLRRSTCEQRACDQTTELANRARPRLLRHWKQTHPSPRSRSLVSVVVCVHVHFAISSSTQSCTISHAGTIDAANNNICNAGAELLTQTLKINFVIRDVGAILDAGHTTAFSDIRAELRRRYRIPIIRFLIRVRAICQTSRCGVTDPTAVVAWLSARAPLWVLVRVCCLL